MPANPLKRAALALPAVRRLQGDRDRVAAERDRLRAERDAVTALADARLEELTSWQSVARESFGWTTLEEVPRFGRWHPGHYYSPVPDPDEVRAREETIFAARAELPGVDLDPAGQLRLVAELPYIADAVNFPDEPHPDFRYHYGNDFYAWGDATMLYGMLRHLRSRRVIEVGSGWSSALLLDLRARCLPDLESLTFVEPYSPTLHDLLRPEDRDSATILGVPVQDVPLEEFEQLEAGDLLFIDSSHVAKVGSDVNHLLFEVMPRLAVGVVVHVHDIFSPFEYPAEWVYEGRHWNEAYLLRAFLAFNDSYRVRLFTSHLAAHHREQVAAALPLWDRNPGGSIYLQRVR